MQSLHPRVVPSAHRQLPFQNNNQNLAYNALSNLHLLDVLLGAVPVRTIHHQPRRESRLAQLFRTGLDVFRGVIRSLGAPPQDDMRERVTLGLDDRAQALLGDGEEGVARGGGAHGVDGDIDGTVGAVLEPDGA